MVKRIARLVLTPGQPTEAGMDEDAEAAYQALLQRGVAPDRIIVLGHSLGSGPAVLLATRHKAAALASLVPGIPPPHKI